MPEHSCPICAGEKVKHRCVNRRCRCYGNREGACTVERRVVREVRDYAQPMTSSWGGKDEVNIRLCPSYLHGRESYQLGVCRSCLCRIEHPRDRPTDAGRATIEAARAKKGWEAQV